MILRGSFAGLCHEPHLRQGTYYIYAPHPRKAEDASLTHLNVCFVLCEILENPIDKYLVILCELNGHEETCRHLPTYP